MGMTKYRCENCGTIHENNKWDEITKKYLENPILLKELPREENPLSYRFICPSCKKLVNIGKE